MAIKPNVRFVYKSLDNAGRGAADQVPVFTIVFAISTIIFRSPGLARSQIDHIALGSLGSRISSEDTSPPVSSSAIASRIGCD